MCIRRLIRRLTPIASYIGRGRGELFIACEQPYKYKHFTRVVYREADSIFNCKDLFYITKGSIIHEEFAVGFMSTRAHDEDELIDIFTYELSRVARVETKIPRVDLSIIEDKLRKSEYLTFTGVSTL